MNSFIYDRKNISNFPEFQSPKNVWVQKKGGGVNAIKLFVINVLALFVSYTVLLM
jgi:hypothetical protein